MGIQNIANVLKKEHTAFITYMVSGYPTFEDSKQVAKTLAESGADLIELGVPFSDPLADGPTIQAAGQKALENGMNLEKCIQLAASLRKDGVEIPMVLMTYYNPILAYGIERCVEDCVHAGVDGFIIPDLPPEESGEIAQVCQKNDLAIVYLLAPNSPPERVSLVAEKSTGFVYLVSLTGVTGAREKLPADLADFVARVRAVTDKPLAVGFGISNGKLAAEVADLADGVIVGSALVKKAAKSMDELRKLAQEIRAGIG